VKTFFMDQATHNNVGLHLKNVFNDNELVEVATTGDFSVVQFEAFAVW
jgi:uncharacterized beta-barrel protein YwiB (DUF1934 family)